MVYTELAPRRQQFHVAPAMPALKYTTSVDIKNIYLKKKKKKKRAIKSWSHVESHGAGIAQWLEHRTRD